MHYAVAWRLMEAARKDTSGRKDTYSFVASLRDIANAFPSMGHAAMDARIDQLAEPKEARFMATRHGEMQVQINTKTGGDLVIQPMTGGAQGDGVMPTVFRRTYEPVLADWMWDKEEDLGSGIEARDPKTGKVVNVSNTVFADDLKEINMVKDAQEAIETIARSGTLLDTKLETMKMKQNVEKAEHVAMFLGSGKEVQTRKLINEMKSAGLGAVRPKARYLGAQLTHNGSPAETVQARIRGAKEAFFAMGKLWK